MVKERRMPRLYLHNKSQPIGETRQFVLIHSISGHPRTINTLWHFGASLHTKGSLEAYEFDGHRIITN